MGVTKQALTPEKEKEFLKYVALCSVCAGVILTEYQHIAFDHRFKNPMLNNHSRRIKESAEQIQKAFSTLAQVGNREDFEYKAVLQMHRLFKYFIELGPDKVEEFMDKVEQSEINNE